MTSKQIYIKTEVYDRLIFYKMPNMSFSTVISLILNHIESEKEIACETVKTVLTPIKEVEELKYPMIEATKKRMEELPALCKKDKPVEKVPVNDIPVSQEIIDILFKEYGTTDLNDSRVQLSIKNYKERKL